MKQSLRWTVAAGIIFHFALVISGCGKRDPKAQAQADLQKLYDEQAAALDRKDMTGAYAYFAPDCVFIGEQDQSYNLAQERMEMTRTFSGMGPNLHFSSSIHNLTPNNPDATQITISVTRMIMGTLFSRQLQRNAPFVLSAEIHDFWVKGASGWQVKREKIGTPQMLIDGKPLALPSSGR